MPPRAPTRERILTLWADDLLSVRLGDDWIFVVDAEDRRDELHGEAMVIPSR